MGEDRRMFVGRAGDGPAYLPAVEALRLFRTRELSPVELLRAVIERAEQTEPVVNAVAQRRFEAALDQAAAAERRYLGRDGTGPRPLEGLPVAAKEHHSIAGLTSCAGSLVDEAGPARENAPIVDRVLRAGGIVHARTTMPELGIATFTHSRRWGVTRNPWNPDYSPGGSSGGSGASLAAGSATLATGSDVGGSIRIPAAFTGTVGFRPPYGRIPVAAPASADWFRTDGPMARTVGDCLLFANALIGPDPRDHASLWPRLELPEGHADVRGMRIAVSVRVGDYRIHPEIATNTRAAASALADAGAVVEELELTWTRERVGRTIAPHFAAVSAAGVVALARDHPSEVCGYTRRAAEQMAQVTQAVSLADGLSLETQLQRELAEAMSGFDALLCPTTTVPAFPAGDELAEGCVLDGVDYGSGLDLNLCLPFNVTSRCPILNVPSGRASCGLPTGVQVVGHPFHDADVFRVGAALQPLAPPQFA